MEMLFVLFIESILVSGSHFKECPSSSTPCSQLILLGSFAVDFSHLLIVLVRSGQPFPVSALNSPLIPAPIKGYGDYQFFFISEVIEKYEINNKIHMGSLSFPLNLMKEQ